MTLPTNPHDRLFRKMMRIESVSSEMLRLMLEEKVYAKLDLTRIEILPESYLSPNLQEYFCDVLVLVPYKNDLLLLVYILIEHKSYNDRNVLVQLLGGQYHIFTDLSGRGEKLKYVICLQVVHPETAANAEEWLSDMLEQRDEDLDEYFPDFRALKRNLHSFPERTQIRVAEARLMIQLLRNCRSPDIIIVLADAFSEIEGSEDEYLLQTVLIYAQKVSRLPKEEFMKLVEQHISSKATEVAETLWEQAVLEGEIKGRTEGRREGRVEGKVEGKIEGLRESIETILNLKLGEDGVRIFRENNQRSSENDLRLLQLKLFQAESKPEILALIS
ncbi:MAG: Rpn family recombination-promoting nuclease/putative transposase [Planctomycetes bacterium]|nr:Rpn family recombination-promoting nuclease/putative transposase [Planctomycetota bacterium]